MIAYVDSRYVADIDAGVMKYYWIELNITQHGGQWSYQGRSNLQCCGRQQMGGEHWFRSTFMTSASCFYRPSKHFLGDNSGGTMESGGTQKADGVSSLLLQKCK
jgi:hypothetical protein